MQRKTDCTRSREETSDSSKRINSCGEFLVKWMEIWIWNIRVLAFSAPSALLVLGCFFLLFSRSIAAPQTYFSSPHTPAHCTRVFETRILRAAGWTGLLYCIQHLVVEWCVVPSFTKDYYKFCSPTLHHTNHCWVQSNKSVAFILLACLGALTKKLSEHHVNTFRHLWGRLVLKCGSRRRRRRRKLVYWKHF